jgi:hypothetical protein
MALYLASRLETNGRVQTTPTGAVRVSMHMADLAGGGCDGHTLYSPSSSGLKTLLNRLIPCIGGESLYVGDDMRIDVTRDRH